MSMLQQKRGALKASPFFKEGLRVALIYQKNQSDKALFRRQAKLIRFFSLG